MIKKIFMLLLILTQVIFSEKYIVQNKEEEKVLENLRKETLYFGLSSNGFYNDKIISDESINDVVKDLFSNYLGLKVEYVKLPFYQRYNDLVDSKIVGTAFINREYSRDQFMNFSETIFNDNLYVVSRKKDVGTLRELNGEYIYYVKGSIYDTFLNSALNNNNFKAKLVEVENLALYENELILTANPILYKPKYGVRIGFSSGSAIGVSSEYPQLVPIINEALNRKYRGKIAKKIKATRMKLALDNFYNSLTPAEKEHIDSLKALNVRYDSYANSLASYYDKNSNTYKGVAPNILNSIGEMLNLKVNDLTNTNENPHIMVFSKTEDRGKDYEFSKKIYDVEVYLINLKTSNGEKRRVGVLKDSVEKNIAKKYDIRENIKEYNSYDELIKALNNREVENILIIKNDFDHSKYNISLFEKVPVNFAFKKRNVIGKNVMDKALGSLIDDVYPTQSAILERKNLELMERKKDEQVRHILITLSAFLLIGSLIVVIKLILESKHKKELLMDPLSKFPNRNVFNSFCDSEGKYIEGYAFIIDIDNFKELNDKYGHSFGDSIIVELSKYLKMKFPLGDIFRISGDEFYGVLQNSYDEIIEKIRSIDSPLFEKHNLTFSTGLYKKSNGENIHTAFKYADMALFKAKKTKGLSFVVADEKFIQEKEREFKILELLEGDLNELYAVYQPKIKIATKEIIGLESLVRCNCKILGDVYPNELIPVAENFDLIHKIDYKVAEESIKFVKELINLNLIDENFRISFNLSVQTFLRDDLVETIKNILEKYEVSGNYVEVEITETILVKDIKDILSKLGSLINLSIQISLDDFTAGHSTARLLPILPINVIKFDKSLLDSLEDNEEKAKIVYSNLTTLVKGLNLKIVSEGIETEKQLDFLKEIDIDYGQGYLFSRPLKKEDYFKFIKKG